MSRSPHRLLLRKTCPVCKQTASFDVGVDEFARWRAGETATVAFGGFTPDQVTHLTTGRHPHCHSGDRPAPRRRFRAA